MKCVLIFSTAYYPFVGGAEIAIKEITDRLGNDMEFDLLTVRFRRSLPAVERVGRITVYRLGVGIPLLDKLLSPFWGAVVALRLTSTRHYSAYWAMMTTYMSGAAYIANIFRFWDPTPIVLTLQEGDSETHLRYRWGGLLHLSWILALRRASFLTVISSYLERRARSLGYRGESALIPNGVDVKKFSGTLIAHEGTVLITTSRLVEKNGIDTVIRALPLLPEVCFQVVGTGQDEKKLKALARELGVSGRVAFLGFVDQSKIPDLLHRADIFIRPSRSEGMGNSFIEAMAAGLPVIATQEGGIADFLFDAKRDPDKEPTGWAVDKNSPEQIAEAVTEILANPAKTKSVVAHARALVAERYDWETVARAMREKVFALL